MKAFFFLSPLLASVALAVLEARGDSKVDYHGYKVLKVGFGDDADVGAQIEGLVAHIFHPGENKSELEVVVSPENLAAVEALALESVVVNEDVGATLDEEGELNDSSNDEMSIAAGMVY